MWPYMEVLFIAQMTSKNSTCNHSACLAKQNTTRVVIYLPYKVNTAVCYLSNDVATPYGISS